MSELVDLTIEASSEQARRRLEVADHTPKMEWAEGEGWDASGTPIPRPGLDLDEDKIEQAHQDADFVSTLMGH